MKAARASLVALLLCWAFARMGRCGGAAADRPGGRSDRHARQRRHRVADARPCRTFEARKGSQIAVLIVPTTAPEAIEQYSIRVAEAWKIGRKKVDDGAILLVAKDDHKLRIEVGYGLEGALTDVAARRIIDEIITPKFRSGDFAGGISAGVDRIIAGHRWRAAAGAGAAADFRRRPYRLSVQSVRHLRGVRRRRIAADPARPADRLGRHRRRGRTGGVVCHRIAGIRSCSRRSLASSSR